MSTYPETPGSKGTDGTSQEAAAFIAPHVTGMRRKVLEAYADAGEATALEMVERTGMGRWSLQPRVSELRRMGMLESTGQRRRNPSGQSAAVQRITQRGMEALK